MDAIKVTFKKENEKPEIVTIPDIDEDVWECVLAYDKENGTNYYDYEIIDVECVKVA